MRTKHLLPLALAAVASIGSVKAQGPIFLGTSYEHPLTVTLQLTSQGAYSRTNAANYTEILKIDTERLSNKEILEALVDDGLISDIKGWSIVLITNDSGEIVGTQIKKRNTESIDISGFFSAKTGTSARSFTGRFDARKGVYQATGRHVALASVGLQVDGFSARVQGLLNVNYLTSGSNLVTVLAQPFPQPPQSEVIQNASFTNLTGSYDEWNEVVRDESNSGGIVTGTVSAGTGTKILRPAD